jgi:glycosyltransferase involved in cell wall biosynthesis
MSQNKVLIVTYYWPPSGGAGVQRILKFAKYLPHFGIEPVILTVENPTYPIIDESLALNIPEGIKVFKTKSLEPYSIYAYFMKKPVSEIAKPTIILKDAKNWKNRVGTFIRANFFIPDARVGWTLYAKSKAKEIVSKYDIETVITTGPPHSTHFVGKYLKKTKNLKWIADFRDPWSEIHYNQFLPRTILAKKIDLSYEKTILKNADEVIVVSNSMAKLQNDIYPRKYRVITNGFDPDDFEEIKHEGYSNEIFTIRHVGSIGETSVPYNFFEALSQLDNKFNYRLEFIGNVHPNIQQLIDKYGLNDKIFIKPYLPHRQAIKAMQESDLLLLVIPNTRNNELILTGKLFDYIGSQTPIMLIGPCRGDAALIIDELRQGNCFEHKDTKSMCHFLSKLLGDRLYSESKSVISDVENHSYSRVTLTSKLADLIQ